MKLGRKKQSPREGRADAPSDRPAQEIERLKRENERLREQVAEQAKRIADLEHELALREQNWIGICRAPGLHPAGERRRASAHRDGAANASGSCGTTPTSRCATARPSATAPSSPVAIPTPPASRSPAGRRPEAQPEAQRGLAHCRGPSDGSGFHARGIAVPQYGIAATGARHALRQQHQATTREESPLTRYPGARLRRPVPV